MPAFGTDPTGTGQSRGPAIVAVVVLLVALSTTYLPEPAQRRIAFGIRASILRPFLAFQNQMAETRIASLEVDVLRARLDSLTAALSTHASLSDENRTLLALLDLQDRIGPDYRPATVLRPGTPGSESMFIVYLGEADGVREGSPVVNRHGLVGVIREVRDATSLGMDWTHPDFRASAMTEDGAAYGMVENRRGSFREADRLVLAGGAYHEEIPDSTLIVTSGLGAVFPRGIPIGRIDGVAETEAEWLKNYWIRPYVLPAEATHVLVAVNRDSVQVADTSDTMRRVFPPDSTMGRADMLARERRDRVRLQAMADTVRRLRVTLGLPVPIPDTLRDVADSLGIPMDSVRLLADSLGVPVQSLTGPGLPPEFQSAIRAGGAPASSSPPVRSTPAPPTSRPSTPAPSTSAPSPQPSPPPAPAPDTVTDTVAPPVPPPADTVPTDTIARPRAPGVRR